MRRFRERKSRYDHEDSLWPIRGHLEEMRKEERPAPAPLGPMKILSRDESRAMALRALADFENSSRSHDEPRRHRRAALAVRAQQLERDLRRVVASNATASAVALLPPREPSF